MTQRITTEYAGQWRKPEDARREQEEAERKASLAEGHQLEPDEHPVAIYNAALDAELEKYVVIDESADGDEIKPGGQQVDEAIVAANAEAGVRAEAASLTRDERLAKNIAREIKGNVLVTDAEDEPADEEAGTGALSQFDEDEANVYYRDDDGNVFAVGKDRDMGREGYYPADFDSEEE